MICGKDGEDSCGSTEDDLKVDLSGRILASGTGLPNSSTLYPNMEDVVRLGH